jgi:[FeFe] hydrogenase (group B1/B3)
MRTFENNVQLIKHSVLREVAKAAYSGRAEEKLQDIPEKIIKGPEPITRCCIYKERAIIEDRARLAMGGDMANENIIQVIDSACDECPISRFVVTEACRGCLAHYCSEACPVGAISHIGGKAFINAKQCIECGKCHNACPYNAISDMMRPCRRACPANAISMDENKKAIIDYEKCILCGACVYQCPFGAIMDKSFITDVIRLLRESTIENGSRIYAVVAPAISSQFYGYSIENIVAALKKLGFHDVVEAALGADFVAYKEANDFVNEIGEKGMMTNSCCPSYLLFVRKQHPELLKHVSETVSPMIAAARLLRKTDPKAKVVFIGPCIAKKGEAMEFPEDIDFVLTFEEVAALFDAAEIALDNLEESPLNNASSGGRIFARSGGLSQTVGEIIGEIDSQVEFRPMVFDGIKECQKAFKLFKLGRLEANFIETMACENGCIGGPASLHHGRKDRGEVDTYAHCAHEKTPRESIRVFGADAIELERKIK